MKEPIDWQLLARYLSNECNSNDIEKVKHWMTSDPENQKWLDEMKAVWQTPDRQYGISDIKRQWVELAEKAGIAENDKMKSKLIKWPLEFKKNTIRILRYAAVLLVAFTLSYLLSKGMNILPWDQSTPEFIVQSVQNGDRKTVNLNDGTRVVLDAGSRLEYPENFTGEIREVYLNGEAFFDVAHQPQTPFVVHANEAYIKVLGTKFNVRAWEQNNKVAVSVADGKVLFRFEKSNDHDAVVIIKGQISFLFNNKQPTKPHSVDINKYQGWMHNEVSFEDVPLGEIVHQIERWYNLKFLFDDPQISTEHMTLYLKNNSISEILELISAMSDLEYKREGNTIYLWSNNTP